MFNSFLFIQRETGGQCSGIHHQCVIYEKAHTPAYFKAGWALQKQIRPVGTQHPNVHPDSFGGRRIASICQPSFYLKLRRGRKPILFIESWKIFDPQSPKHFLNFSFPALTLPDRVFHVSDVCHCSWVISITRWFIPILYWCKWHSGWPWDIHYSWELLWLGSKFPVHFQPS